MQATGRILLWSTLSLKLARLEVGDKVRLGEAEVGEGVKEVEVTTEARVREPEVRIVSEVHSKVEGGMDTVTLKWILTVVEGDEHRLTSVANAR